MSLIDKLGRKTLLLIGAAGDATCLRGVAWLLHSHSHPGALLWLLVTYIAFFSVSQGAVIWVYIGEVFPTSVRSKGQGVGTASHWFMNALIALEFPVRGALLPTANSVHLLLRDDGGAVPGGAVHLSGDQRADARSIAAEAGAGGVAVRSRPCRKSGMPKLQRGISCANKLMHPSCYTVVALSDLAVSGILPSYGKPALHRFPQAPTA